MTKVKIQCHSIHHLYDGGYLECTGYSVVGWCYGIFQVHIGEGSSLCSC